MKKKLNKFAAEAIGERRSLSSRKQRGTDEITMRYSLVGTTRNKMQLVNMSSHKVGVRHWVAGLLIGIERSRIKR